MKRQGLEGEFESVVELSTLELSLFSDDPSMPKNRLAVSLLSMGIHILKAKEGNSFITSDAPFCFESLDKFTVSCLYFPLSTKYAVIFDGLAKGADIEVLDGQDVLEFNRSLLSANNLWTVALSKEMLPIERAALA